MYTTCKLKINDIKKILYKFGKAATVVTGDACSSPKS